MADPYAEIADPVSKDPYAAVANPVAMSTAQTAPKIGRTESLARGVYSGAIQQPRDVIAAATAKIVGGVPFKEGLEMARESSLQGRQGQARERHPNYFTGGEIAGNIALTAVPAASATRAVGAVAPIASKAPIIGKTLAKTAQGIGASKGLVGVPLSGAIQGGISTLASQGDLSGAPAGAIGAGVIGAAGKLARPIADTASAARKGYLATLKAEGIDDLTAAQMTGNKTLEIINSVLEKMPFTAGKAEKATEKQIRQFTAAALKKAGLTGDDISPAVREAAEAQFSQRYGDLMKNEIVKIDTPVIRALSKIESSQLNKLPTTVKPIVQSYMDDILNSGGQLTGDAYQVARSNLGRQARSMSISDPFTASTLREIRQSLDDAAERSLSGAKKGAWRKLNRQYANYKIIQKAASSVSKDSLEGVLTPKALMGAVEKANKTKSQRGYNELYDLARAGRSVLSSDIPDSGTAQRALAQHLITGGLGASAVGGTTYGATHDPETALMAAGASIASPLAIQAFLNSPAGRAYLTKGITGAGVLGSRTAKQMGALISANLAKEKK